MRTREIPIQQWHLFFSDFTLLHQSQHVDVETLSGGDFGALSRVSDMPLVGIILADAKPENTGGRIDVIAGETPDHRATCTIDHPSRVYLAEEDNGQTIALQVTSAEGNMTMVRFGAASAGLPEGFLVA